MADIVEPLWGEKFPTRAPINQAAGDFFHAIRQTPEYLQHRPRTWYEVNWPAWRPTHGCWLTIIAPDSNLPHVEVGGRVLRIQTWPNGSGRAEITLHDEMLYFNGAARPAPSWTMEIPISDFPDRSLHAMQCSWGYLTARVPEIARHLYAALPAPPSA